jgi:hypothetical protein
VDKIEQSPGENREYNLICDFEVINQSYHELADGRRHESETIVLIPNLESTETSRFLMTYLPDISTICLDCKNDELRIYSETCPKCGSKRIHTEHTEVPAWIGAPIHSPCRLAVLRKNSYCNSHHLYVMSTGVESEFKQMPKRKVNITILSSLEDNICDTAPSVARTAKTI